jgi:glutaredoxin
MKTLTNSNFDNNAKCDQNIGLIVGIMGNCSVCKKLQENLNKSNINYGLIDLTSNMLFLRNIKKKANLDTNIAVPLIMIYNNGEFVKLSKITSDPAQIIY